MVGFDGGLESRGRPDSGSEDERLGARLLKTGVLTPEQLARCLTEQGRLATAGHPTSLADVLLRKGFISGPSLTEALSDVWVDDFIAAGTPPEVAAQSESERFGKFTRVQQLGSGGMGEVWKAWDNQLGRWVALKFLKGRDRADIARLLREAQTAGRLSHANIVAVHEVGSERGEHYIAMQYIEGQTMETYPRKDRKGLVRLIRDAARAVALAHREGIVHRDLKPSNLMVAVRPGADPHVYVADFGLARSMSDPNRLSRSGVIQGTPEYMSPEQAQGEPVDERTDVWALGATLYELTTDRLPFAASNLVNLLRRIVDEDPKPPRKIQPRISQDLETIILKCLEKDPARRYASADDLAEDLDRYLSREPIQARPAGVFYRVRKRLAKRKALVAVTAAALVAVSALWGTLMFRARPERQQLLNFQAGMVAWEELLRSSFGRIEPETFTTKARATRAHFEEANRWVEKPEAHIMRGRCCELEGDGEAALKALEQAFALQKSHTEARVELARALLAKYQRLRGTPQVTWEPEVWVGDLREESPQEKDLRDRAANLLKGVAVGPGKADLLQGLLAMGRGEYGPAADRLRRHSNVDGLDTQSMLLEGMCRFLARKFEAAVEALERSIRLAPHPAAYTYIGLALQAMKDFDGAIRAYDRAIALEPMDARNYIEKGTALRYRKDYAASIRDYTRAIELDPKIAKAYTNRANSRFYSGDMAGAAEDNDRAIQLDPTCAVFYYNRGLHRTKLGDLRKAVEDFTRAIELEPKRAVPYMDRANVLRDLGETAKALKDYDMAVRLDPGRALNYVNRSAGRHSAGDFAGSLEDINKAIELNPKDAFAYMNRGVTLASQKQYPEALADFARSLELDPEDWRTYFNRGMVLLNLKDSDAAARDLDKCIALNCPRALPYYERGILREGRNDLPGALADFSKAIEIDPKLGPAHGKRGVVRHKMGDAKGSIPDYDRAIELDPGNCLHHHHRGFARQELLDFNGAVADYGRAIELNPKLGVAHNNRGNCRLILGKTKEAIEDYNRSIALDPRFGLGYANRAKARRLLRDYSGSMEDLKKAIELVPDRWEPYYILATLHVSLGRKPEALDAIELAVAKGLTSIFALKNDPDLSLLRAEERFKKLVDRLKTQ